MHACFLHRVPPEDPALPQRALQPQQPVSPPLPPVPPPHPSHLRGCPLLTLQLPHPVQTPPRHLLPGYTPGHHHPESGAVPGGRQQGHSLHHPAHRQPPGAADAPGEAVRDGAGHYAWGTGSFRAEQEDTVLCAAAGRHLLGAVCDHVRGRGGVWATFH